MNFHISKSLSLIAICGASFAALSSCSDNDSAPAPELKQYQFSGRDNLAINYCGSADPGKTVTVIPDGKNATLQIGAEFDLSQLGIEGLEGTVPVAGLIPGTPVLSLPVALSAGDGVWNFSGTGETADCKFTYSGSFSPDKMNLLLPEVTLKDQSLAGTVLAPSPLLKNTEGLGYSSTPFHIVWDIDPIPGVDIDLKGVLTALATLPCIPVYHDTAYSSVAQLLSQSLKTVALTSNGNVVIRYMGNSQGATILQTMPLTMVQYTPAGVGGMKIYLNVEQLAGQVLVAHPGGFSLPEVPAELKPILLSMAKNLSPYLAEGIPMQYAPTADGLEVYFPTETAMTILTEFLKGVKEDPAVEASIKKLLASEPLLAPYLPQFETLLGQLPTILGRTTRFELGLSFKRYQPA